jgi:hypothetical protein
VVRVPHGGRQPLPRLRALDARGGVRPLPGDERGPRPDPQPLVRERDPVRGAARQLDAHVLRREAGRVLHRRARSRGDRRVLAARVRALRRSPGPARHGADAGVLHRRAGDALLRHRPQQPDRAVDEGHVPALPPALRIRPAPAPARPLLRRRARQRPRAARLLQRDHRLLRGRLLPPDPRLVPRARRHVHRPPAVRGVAAADDPGRGQPLQALSALRRDRRRPPLSGDRDARPAGGARGDEGRLVGGPPERQPAAAVRVVRRDLHGHHHAAHEVDHRLGVRPRREPAEPARVPLHARGPAQARLAALDVLPVSVVAVLRGVLRVRQPPQPPPERRPPRRRRGRDLADQRDVRHLPTAGAHAARRPHRARLQRPDRAVPAHPPRLRLRGRVAARGGARGGGPARRRRRAPWPRGRAADGAHPACDARAARAVRRRGRPRHGRRPPAGRGVRRRRARRRPRAGRAALRRRSRDGRPARSGGGARDRRARASRRRPGGLRDRGVALARAARGAPA